MGEIVSVIIVLLHFLKETMVSTIHDSISEIYQESQSVYERQKEEPKIEIGSDHYLDIANEQSANFNSFSDKLRIFNDKLIRELNSNDVVVYAVLQDLRDLYGSLMQTYVVLANSSLAPAMKIAIDYYKAEALQLKETIEDTKRMHNALKTDEILQSLFRQL